MLVGPLVARFGVAKLYPPGGDKIGRRRIDTHLVRISKLELNSNYKKIFIKYLALNLKAIFYFLKKLQLPEQLILL